MAKGQRPKFYVVWKGHQPGVYASWSECQQQVSGYSDAKFKSFATRAEAERALAGQYQQYVGQTRGGGSRISSRPALTREELQRQGVILDSVCVDAACCGNPGELEYRGVETATGELLFDAGPFDEGTVNIGEFLAIVQALAMLKLEGRTCPVYSDSMTAMVWVRRRIANTKLPRTAANDALFQMVEWGEKWLRDNPYPNRILKWQTDQWGEIPADYGRK
jgi:ribonuclease HI